MSSFSSIWLFSAVRHSLLRYIWLTWLFQWKSVKHFWVSSYIIGWSFCFLCLFLLILPITNYWDAPGLGPWIFFPLSIYSKILGKFIQSYKLNSICIMMTPKFIMPFQIYTLNFNLYSNCLLNISTSILPFNISNLTLYLKLNSHLNLNDWKQIINKKPCSTYSFPHLS